MKIAKINEFIEHQIQEWPLAKENYDALGRTERRAFHLGDLDVYLQHNPARIRSTAAAVEKKDIEARPCFLCKENRPKEQMAYHEFDPSVASEPIFQDWEILVNPYPIFPVHFTIPSRRHIPQDNFPLEMATFAEMMPGLAIFFNGAKAGASAPDHLHMQAVLAAELPLLRLAEEKHPSSKPGLFHSSELDIHTPFTFYSAIITPDLEGMRTLANMEKRLPSRFQNSLQVPSQNALQNVFMWLGPDGLLRAIIIPRSAHRPDCYFAQGDAQRLISPGAIDMAGVIIAPRHEDFENLSQEEIDTIYTQTGIK